MNSAALFRCPVVVGVLMTAACALDHRELQITDGAPGAAGQAGNDVVRDASQETSDAGPGTGGAGGTSGAGGTDASIDGNTGAGGSTSTGGSGGAAGNTGSGGTAGATGSGGATGTGGASGGVGGTGGATGGAAGASGSTGSGGAAGTSGAGGAAGTAGKGGAAGTSGTGGAAGTAGASGTGATGGSGGTAGNGAGGASGGSGGIDAGNTSGAAGQTGQDVRDVWTIDATGTVVLFEEHFPTDLGKFHSENGCGTSPLWTWRDNGIVPPYAHAEISEELGVSSLLSTPIFVPGNVSGVQLHLNHQIVTESGHDGGQVLVTVNGQETLATSFTQKGYENNLSVNADCSLASPGTVAGWSGGLNTYESVVDLSAAPFNVGPGDTIYVRLRILVDNGTSGGGWDVDSVEVTGVAQ